MVAAILVLVVLGSLFLGFIIGGGVVLFIILAGCLVWLLITAMSGSQEPLREWPLLLSKEARSQNEDKTVVVTYQGVSDREVPEEMKNMLERAYISLSSSLFDDASVYFDRLLDMDSHFAPAYIGKILCSFKIRDEKNLIYSSRDFTKSPYWDSACRFATEEELEKYKRYQSERAKNYYEAVLNDFNSYKNLTSTLSARQNRSYEFTLMSLEDTDNISGAAELREQVQESMDEFNHKRTIIITTVTLIILAAGFVWYYFGYK